MAMKYQKGTVYPSGKKVKMWYGKYMVYRKDQEGKEVRKFRCIKICRADASRDHSERDEGRRTDPNASTGLLRDVSLVRQRALHPDAARFMEPNLQENEHLQPGAFT
jgi:hypothetical protein